jgi:Protein of unknown function (DUF550)
MIDWKKLSDREVLDAMQADTPVNRVRKVFSGEAARIEQAGMQRIPPAPIEYRRMEFEAAEKMIAALTTFGPGQRTAGVIDHILKELIEVEQAPRDLFRALKSGHHRWQKWD